jgi:hypothetical protein
VAHRRAAHHGAAQLRHVLWRARAARMRAGGEAHWRAWSPGRAARPGAASPGAGTAAALWLFVSGQSHEASNALCTAVLTAPTHLGKMVDELTSAAPEQHTLWLLALWRRLDLGGWW